MPVGYKVFMKTNKGLTPITDVGRAIVPKFDVGKDITAPVGGFFLYGNLEDAVELANGIYCDRRRLVVHKVQYSRVIRTNKGQVGYAPYYNHYLRGKEARRVSDAAKEAWSIRGSGDPWWWETCPGSTVAKTIRILEEVSSVDG